MKIIASRKAESILSLESSIKSRCVSEISKFKLGYLTCIFFISARAALETANTLPLGER